MARSAERTKTDFSVWSQSESDGGVAAPVEAPTGSREWLDDSGRTNSEKRHILAISSSGGVLLELLALRPWFDRHEIAWVAVRAPDTEAALADANVQWIAETERGSPGSVVRSFTSAWRVLGEQRPDLIISAGTGVAVGFYLAARLRGVPSLWIDTFNLVGRPGRVARLCGHLALATLVQRADLVDLRPRGIFVGELY
jgi:hypothetical protein